MKSDIEIAHAAALRPITAIAESLGLSGTEIEPYGAYKAKIPFETMARFDGGPDGAAYAGDIMTMPGLPKKPAAETMDIDGQGGVHGLF